MHVLKQFFTYVAGSFFVRCITVFVAPLIMHLLPPAQYGALALVQSFINIANSIMGLGLRQLLAVEYFHATNTERKILINDIILVYLALALPVVSIGIYFRAPLTAYMFANQVSSDVLVSALGVIFFWFFVELAYQLFQYNERARLLACMQIAVALVANAITLIFVWYLATGIAGIFYAQIIGMIITCSIACYFYLRHGLHYHVMIKQSLKKMHRYLYQGFPFIPSLLFTWILSSGNRWVLAHYDTLEHVALYSVADMFAQLFYFFVIYPWNGSYLPYIMHQFKKNAASLYTIEMHNRRVMAISIAILMIGLAAGYLLFTPLIMLIIPHAYHRAIPYIFILLLGQTFLLASHFASCVIQFQKRTYLLLITICIPAVLNIIMSRMLVTSWHLAGCASATVSAYIIYFLITLGCNQWIICSYKDANNSFQR